MAIPDFQSIMLPILQLLSDDETHTVKEIRDSLADQFQLSDEERQLLLNSGQQTLFGNRVAWAQSHLKQAGLLASPARGRIAITQEGRTVLKQQPGAINCQFLKQFPPYLSFIGKSGSQENNQSATVSGEDCEVDDEKTPIEQIESAVAVLRKTLADDLLDKMKSCSSGFFERIVVELLHAMGYGGVSTDAMHLTNSLGSPCIPSIDTV